MLWCPQREVTARAISPHRPRVDGSARKLSSARYMTSRWAIPSYRRTSVEEGSLFIFLSGARAAVGKLADDAYKMLKERRAQ